MDEQDRIKRAEWSFETKAAHAGKSVLHEGAAGSDIIPTVKPVYLSTAFVASTIDEMDQVFAGEEPGYVYTRYANPTTTDLEHVVAELEGAEPDNAVAFGSPLHIGYASEEGFKELHTGFFGITYPHLSTIGDIEPFPARQAAEWSGSLAVAIGQPPPPTCARLHCRRTANI